MTIPDSNPMPPVESLPPESPGTWGAPVPAGERKNTPWSTKKIIISAAVAVVIVAGGTAAVMAATNGNSSTSSGGGFPGGAGGGFPGGGRFGAAAGLMNALHGDFVVANGSNGYTTERLQTGTVQAASSTSLTVKSTDGYTQTYVIGSSTSVDGGSDSISKVANGNTVTVVATLSGQTATATTVEDSTIDSSGTGRAGSGQGGFGGGSGAGGGNGGPPGN